MQLSALLGWLYDTDFLALAVGTNAQKYGLEPLISHGLMVVVEMMPLSILEDRCEQRKI
jgi:hypothetical protein